MKIRRFDLERLIQLGLGRLRPRDALRERSAGDRMPGRVAAAHGIERDRLAKVMDEYYAAWGWYHDGASPPLG